MKRLLKKQKTSFVYSSYYLLAQDKWAQKMNYLTQNLSKRKLMFFLIVFIVMSAGFFLYNIYAVVSKNDAAALKNNSSITTIHNK